VPGLEAPQREIEGQEIDRSAGGRLRERFVERDFECPLAPLRAARAHVIDQDAPHDVRRQRKKVIPIVDFDALQSNETHEGLVHDRRRLQRVTTERAAKQAIGPVAQLTVEEWHQSVERAGVTGPPGGQCLRYVVVTALHRRPRKKDGVLFPRRSVEWYRRTRFPMEVTVKYATAKKYVTAKHTCAVLLLAVVSTGASADSYQCGGTIDRVAAKGGVFTFHCAGSTLDFCGSGTAGWFNCHYSEGDACKQKSAVALAAHLSGKPVWIWHNDAAACRNGAQGSYAQEVFSGGPW